MEFTEKNISDLKQTMIKKYGKTSYRLLSEELGVSRQAINNAIFNFPSMDKLRERIVKWIENNK